jgi:hypothetical protein
VRGVDVPCDAEHPRPRRALAGVEGGEGGDHGDERVGGEVGDGLRVGGAPGEERGDGVDVGPVEPLELGARALPASVAGAFRVTPAARELEAPRLVCCCCVGHASSSG